MKYYIITGTSRGLGEALASQLIKPGNTLFCISRGANEKLSKSAKEVGITLHYIQQDIGLINKLPDMIRDIFDKIDSEPEGVHLINNAGMLAPVKPVEKCEAADIEKNITVNLIAPMVISSEFIKRTSGMECQKRIINISSGAATKPYYGWSSYCTAKCGLDMHTRNIANEEEGKEFPVEALALAPGIIDTEMQVEIRASDKEDFVLLDRFIMYKNEGKLAPADEVAAKTIRLIHSDDFEQGGILDVRNM